MRNMARVQPRGIANRNVWAKEEITVNRAENKLLEQSKKTSKEARRENFSEGMDDQLDVFSLKSSPLFSSLGPQCHHKPSQ